MGRPTHRRAFPEKTTDQKQPLRLRIIDTKSPQGRLIDHTPFAHSRHVKALTSSYRIGLIFQSFFRNILEQQRVGVRMLPRVAQFLGDHIVEDAITDPQIDSDRILDQRTWCRFVASTILITMQQVDRRCPRLAGCPKF
jgi:hypothetical protein